MIPLNSISLSQFVEQRACQDKIKGRLLVNCTHEDITKIWEYLSVVEKEYPSTMTDDEQFMLACFILLAEGQDLPI